MVLRGVLAYGYVEVHETLQGFSHGVSAGFGFCRDGTFVSLLSVLSIHIQS